MALLHIPKRRQILSCDFRGYEQPEIIKIRPIVVIQVTRSRPRLCTVVPLSSTPPDPIEPWHYQLPRRSNWDRTPRWAKCDMLAQVSFARLDRWSVGKRGPKRQYLSNFLIQEEDYKAILRGILHAIGLMELTQYV